MFSKIKQIHYFLSYQGLYPVLLSTILACLILMGRFYLSRNWSYDFLLWNLFLAWVPYLCSLWITYLFRRQPNRRWGILLFGVIWLIFFPNAPYIITDFLHLSPRPRVPLWYDIGLLATFAWSGLFLAVFSLRSMQTLIKTMFGSLVGWVFTLNVVGISGLGIYLGRFLRWNSWDLFLRPRAVLTDVIEPFIDPLSHRQSVGVTLIFAAFLLVCYLTITSGPATEADSA